MRGVIARMDAGKDEHSDCNRVYGRVWHLTAQDVLKWLQIMTSFTMTASKLTSNADLRRCSRDVRGLEKCFSISSKSLTATRSPIAMSMPFIARPKRELFQRHVPMATGVRTIVINVPQIDSAPRYLTEWKLNASDAHMFFILTK